MMALSSPIHELTSQAGAEFVEQAGWLVPSSFGKPLAEYEQAYQRAALFDRSSLGKIELTGGEAAIFLHNLCTNDVKSLPVGAGCEAFLTTPQARIVAPILVYHLRLHDQRSALWLEVPAGRNETVLKHLDHHLISEAAEFADRTADFAQLHLAGPWAGEVLGKALQEELPPLEEHQHMMRTFGNAATSHVRKHAALGVPGYSIVCLKSRSADVWRSLLAAGAQPAGQTAYDWLRVEAGMPSWGPDIDEKRLVMEVGRTKQAICYTKGCFLGQEPIVMARDRGHVNRTLLGVKLPGGVVPVGTKLTRESKEAGTIMSSIVSPRLGQAIGLAYIWRGHQEPGTMLEADLPSGRIQAEVCSLPFVSS